MVALGQKLLILVAFLAGAAHATETSVKVDSVEAAAKVVSTEPSNGAAIEPGPYSLTVTFDRPMARRSYSFVQVSAASYPQCLGKPMQSADGHSFTLRCIASAGKRHEIWFNRKPYMNFRGKVDGQSATPYRLQFAVKP